MAPRPKNKNRLHIPEIEIVNPRTRSKKTFRGRSYAVDTAQIDVFRANAMEFALGLNGGQLGRKERLGFFPPPLWTMKAEGPDAVHPQWKRWYSRRQIEVAREILVRLRRGRLFTWRLFYEAYISVFYFIDDPANCAHTEQQSAKVASMPPTQ